MTLTRADILTAELTEGEKVMWRFRDAVKNKTMLSENDINFLNVAFGKILDGEAPKKALNIEKPQGRKRRCSSNNSELAIATKVALLESQSVTHAEALRIVAKECVMSTRNVDRYCAKQDGKVWAEFIQSIPERSKEFAEIKKIFGDEIGEWPCTTINRLTQALKAAKPSEYLDIQRAVEAKLKAKKA